MASAKETNVSQESQDGPEVQPREDSPIARFVLETGKLVLLENGRLQDFPYMADRSADLLDGNKILKQILSEITSKCDEKTAYEEMQKCMYRLVLEELLKTSSYSILAISALVLLQKSLLATMEYLVPYSEAIKRELQPEKIANELKTKLDEYTRCEIDGEAYLRSSDHKKAIQYYKRAHAISTELGYQLAIDKECQNLANLYISIKQYEDAIVYLNEYLKASVIGNQERIADTNRNLGLVYSKLKRYKESIDCLKKSLDLYTKLKNSKEIALTSRGLGEVYLSFEQYEEASRHFNDSLAMYITIKDQSGIADIKWNLGRLFAATNQHKKCVEHLKEFIAINADIGNQSKIAGGNTDLGSVYLFLEEYEKAITHFQIALDISEDGSGQATNCRYLGQAYVELARYEKGISYYNKALEISTKIGDRLEMTRSNTGLGHAHYFFEKFEKAIEYFEKALAIATDLKNQNLIATINGNMGDVYLRMRQPEKALECCKRGLTLSTGDQLCMAYSNGRLGNIYLVSFKFDEAIASFEKAIEISNPIRNRKIKSNYYAGLGYCYYFIYQVQLRSGLRSGLEPLKRSMSYFRTSIECYDSIF